MEDFRKGCVPRWLEEMDKLEPAIRDSIRRTGVIAELVSTDDGYASAKGRDELKDMEGKIISINGAKGKKTRRIGTVRRIAMDAGIALQSSR